MSKPIPALKISNAAHNEILAYLRHQLSGGDDGQVLFRRVSRVVAKNPITITKIPTPDAKSETLQNLKGVSKSDIERYIQIDYRSFYGFTQARSVRDEPKEFDNLELFFHSDNYAQVDTTLEFTFGFSEDRRLCGATTPIVGDLLFMFYSNDTIRKAADFKQNPRADKWFVCSEQFLRAWTAIMYDWHETFDHLIPRTTPKEERESVLRSKLFSGNKLMTNAWLKHKLALGARGEKMDLAESTKRYWHLRTEYASKRWVDIWACMVLVARYGELPCPANIPNTLGDGPQRVTWDLPAEFVSMLVRRGTHDAAINASKVENYSAWNHYSRSRTFFTSCGAKGPRRLGFLDDIARTRSDRVEKSPSENPNHPPQHHDNLPRPQEKSKPEEPPNIQDLNLEDFPALPKPSISWAKIAARQPEKKAVEEPEPKPKPKSVTRHIFKTSLPPIPKLKSKTGQKTVSISFELQIPEDSSDWDQMAEENWEEWRGED